MRILHLITRMDRGGSAVNTLTCALAQQRAGHAVHLGMGPSMESDMSADERMATQLGLDAFRDAGGIIHALPCLFRRLGLHDLRAWRQMRALIGQVRPEVVHTHTSKAGALGRLAAWGRARAVVHTPHGHIFHGYFGPAKTRAFVWVERRLAHRCHALVALTAAERDDHLQFRIGSPAQWHVVPSGVPVQALAESVQRQRQAHGDAPVWQAVSVGRLVPIKGMDRLVRAWAAVQAERPGARLAIVGDGPERPRLEALIGELGLGEHVMLAGWQDPLSYLASAECFALLSHNEGMGRAVVEALAAGLPCVVSNVCGLAELVDDSVGAVVDADDAASVAQALLRRWDDGIGERARAKAGDYAEDVMVARLETLYRALLRGAGS